MNYFGNELQLKQRLIDNVDRLDDINEEVEQKRSQKWLGMLAAGIGTAYSLPVVENIVYGAYESVPPTSYGGVVAAGIGVVVGTRAARKQRELEQQARTIAHPTHELIRFMDAVSIEFDIPELSCKSYNLGIVDRHLSPKSR